MMIGTEKIVRVDSFNSVLTYSTTVVGKYPTSTSATVSSVTKSE